MMKLMNGDRSGAREEEAVVGCGASNPLDMSSESDGMQVADTEDKENKVRLVTSTCIGKPLNSASGRRALKLKKKNSGTDAMEHRLNYEDRTSHFAKMQAKQVEAITMMAKAQLLQAENEAKRLEMQKDSNEELQKFRVEFARMTSYVGHLVEWMTGENAKKSNNE